MTDVLKKKNGEKRQGRRPYKDRGRNWSDAFASKGMLKIATAPEARRLSWHGFSLCLVESTNPAHTLISDY